MTALAVSTQEIDLIRRQLETGAPWEACDSFRDALSRAPDDADLLYWGALAYARVGAGHDALVLLDRAQAHIDGAAIQLDEVLSLRGRIWKDRLLQATDEAERERCAGRAREHYLAGYALRRGNPYPGINAASLSLIAGDRRTATALAQEVLTVLAAQDGQPGDWDDATAGEAHLLLGETEQALARYRRAVLQAGANAGRVASMRRQIQLLTRVLPAAEQVLPVLQVPTVLAFVGHLIDAPGREAPRFPATAVPAVSQAIRSHLAALGPLIVYTSAASGADLLLIECALDAGAEVNIILPFDRQDFVRTSVAPGGAAWVERFDRLLPRAHHLFMATDELHLGDDELFDHAAQLVEGLAVLRAQQLQTRPQMLCVLDTRADGGTGGAKASAERWGRHHGQPIVVDLNALRDAPRPPDVASGLAPQPTPDAVASIAAPAERPRRTVKALLFADFAGFGRLHDAHAPLFHARFLEIIAGELKARAVQPLEANTWGDALYVVFEHARDGAEFALDLRQRMAAVDWTAAGLPASSRLRIAMHAGPVFCGFDPIIGRDNYFGSSVTRAARIEPVTPPGLVYVSEAYAATLIANGQTGYAFEYVGRLALAKNHGESRLYRLERH